MGLSLCRPSRPGMMLPKTGQEFWALNFNAEIQNHMSPSCQLPEQTPLCDKVREVSGRCLSRRNRLDRTDLLSPKPTLRNIQEIA